MPDAIIFIYMTFQWYCRNLQEGPAVRPVFLQEREANRNTADLGWLISPKFSSDLLKVSVVLTYIFAGIAKLPEKTKITSKDFCR